MLPLGQWISDQPQTVFAQVSWGVFPFYNRGTLLIDLFASTYDAKCQMFVLEAGFLQACCQMPSLAVEHRLPLCHLPSLIPRMSFQIRRDKAKIILVAFCWLGAILSLRCITFSQSSWAKSWLKDSDSLCHMTRWTPQASSPYHHGNPNTCVGKHFSKQQVLQSGKDFRDKPEA